MKKLKVIVAFACVALLMNSCIYSLFPIFTDETREYLPELLGKWQEGDDPGNYIIFESGMSYEGTVKVTANEPSSSEPKSADDGKVKVKVGNPEFTIEFDGDEYIVLEGDTIRDKAKIEEYYREELKEFSTKLIEEELPGKLEKLSRGLERIASSMKGRTDFQFEKSAESYLMTVYNDGKQEAVYEATLTKIEGDYFLDIFATDSKLADQAFSSMVWFPVHSFMKVEMDGDKMALTQFDYDKLNKLFKSNLIRLRHEDVDGTILITAQSPELRKFLGKYSKDESVFDNPNHYSRVQ